MVTSATIKTQSPCRLLAGEADAVLARCDELVARVPASCYTADSLLVPGGTLGKHVRHTLDHFAAALGVGGGVTGVDGVIDYDHRERDVPVERDPVEARRAIAALRRVLREFEGSREPVRVRVMVNASGECAELGSTRGRELAFATHHAIHHQAMMRTIAGELGVNASLDDAFGKAPSTVEHERARRP